MDTDTNSTVVTMVTPIFIADNNNEAVAAVIGLQMKYNKFKEFFDNTIQPDINSSDIVCASEVSQYIVKVSLACNGMVCVLEANTNLKKPFRRYKYIIEYKVSFMS